MARVGVFGGTFDPPHLGHMILAAEAADQLQRDEVRRGEGLGQGRGQGRGQG